MLFCFSQLSGQSFVANQLLIQTHHKVDLNDRNMSFKTQDIQDVEVISKSNNIYLLHFNAKVDLDRLIFDLSSNANIKHIQKNHIVEYRQEPNDALWNSQWNMLRISADKVWDLVTGGQTANGDEIVIAVIDDGFQIDHEDLVNNVWTNQAEIADNGIDDDQNGFIDDLTGWNFQTNSGIHPQLEHGTSIAGVIGAQGNNAQGITGVNFDVKLLLLSGANVESKIVAAYDYIIDLREKYNNSNGTDGAFIVSTNFSAGIGYRFGSDFPLWCSMFDKMGEVGIISASAVDNNIYNVDIEGDMPTTCQSDFLITVSNSTQEDGLDAAYGKINIDLAAPGDQVITTDNNNGYHSLSGSSLSTPHVTGAIGLLYASACPDLLDQIFTEPKAVAQTMKSAIMNGTVPLISFEGKTVTEGRLDLFESVRFLQENCGGSIGEIKISHKTAEIYNGETYFLYETPNFDIYNFHVVDVLGKTVYYESIRPPAFELKEIKVNTSGWASGIYYYSIYNDSNVANGSFYKP